jgi:drug/metabolite transporter (DMT)-like permease
MMNIGKGVQKQKVHVFRRGLRMFARPHRRDLGIWLLGLGITAGAAVPYSVGLKLSGSPSAVSAMTGVGLIGLTVYALAVIGERMGPLDVLGMLLVVAGTSTLAALGAGQGLAARAFEDRTLIPVVLALALPAAAACLLARRYRRVHGLAHGLAAGLCIGLAIFIADLGLVRTGGSLGGQLATPYPWVALVFAASATVVTQLGFLRGRALEVVPAVNAATVLTPLLLELVIYGAVPTASRVLVIALILAGVVLLSTGAAARVSAGEGSTA